MKPQFYHGGYGMFDSCRPPIQALPAFEDDGFPPPPSSLRFSEIRDLNYLFSPYGFLRVIGRRLPLP